MPLDPALITARLGKPRDLRHPVTDRDQNLPTVSVATQANARDLPKRHVDHAAHSQSVLVRRAVFHYDICPLPNTSGSKLSLESNALAGLRNKGTDNVTAKPPVHLPTGF